MHRTVAALAATLLAAAVVSTAPAGAQTPPGAPLPCGVRSLAEVSQPAGPVPGASAVRKVLTGVAVMDFTVVGDVVHVLQGGPERASVTRVPLRGGAGTGFPIPFRVVSDRLVVDGQGATYVARYPSTLVKLDQLGRTVWERPVPGQEVTSLFAAPGSPFRVGATSRGQQGATLFDASGGPAGTSGIHGGTVTTTPDGGVLAVTGGYVNRFRPDGTQAGSFGSDQVSVQGVPTGGPLSLYQPGAALDIGGGRVLVADAGRGIHEVTSDGLWIGTAQEAVLGVLVQRSPLALVGDQIVFAAGRPYSGEQGISVISLRDLRALVAAPKAPSYVLGFGAGLTTGRVGNYVPPGEQPQVRATFAPWWGALGGALELRTSVRDRADVVAGRPGLTAAVRLPAGGVPAEGLAIAVPAGRPGAYEVDARLVRDGAVVGATCLRYTVGFPGAPSLDGLPGGSDFGGAAPPRGVALADLLGVGDFRGGIDWARLLPNRNGALDFSAYDQAFRQAADEARRRGVHFHVQIGQGGPVETALVQDGSWGRRVAELVAHFRGVVPAWEAWNEPNITFRGSPADFVNKVLKPVAASVNAADPAALVVGPSAIGMDIGWLDAFGKAGGFGLLDVVAIHPYTGHNRSWEENGTPAAINGLREVMTRNGAAQLPIWNTEGAWWSDGPANIYSQADKAARALLWSKALGVQAWNYFMIEGGYGDYGFTYSLIQASSKVDYLKPAGLAMMAADQQVGGRPFEGMVQLGIPHTYAARFGGGDGGVLAVWTDDVVVPAVLQAAGPVQVVDVFGAARPVSPGRVDLSGSPQYFRGGGATIAPVEAFGADIAKGGRTSASSHAQGNPASAAVDGVADARNGGDLAGLPAWSSAPGDRAPSLTVELGRSATVNRVVVATHSIGSIVPGLRDYDVQVRNGGEWTTVGAVRGQFHQRTALLWFAPTSADAVRVTVGAVNNTGQVPGGRPWFWVGGDGTAVIYELEAYEGRSGPPAAAPGDTAVAGTTQAQAAPAAPAPAAPAAAAPAPAAPAAAAPALPAPPQAGQAVAPEGPRPPLRASHILAGLAAVLLLAVGYAGWGYQRSRRPPR